MKKNNEHTICGIPNKGFSGMRRFVARKKVQCNLIRNRLVIPHDTIPKPLWAIIKKYRLNGANHQSRLCENEKRQ